MVWNLPEPLHTMPDEYDSIQTWLNYIAKNPSAMNWIHYDTIRPYVIFNDTDWADPQFSMISPTTGRIASLSLGDFKETVNERLIKPWALLSKRCEENKLCNPQLGHKRQCYFWHAVCQIPPLAKYIFEQERDILIREANHLKQMQNDGVMKIERSQSEWKRRLSMDRMAAEKKYYFNAGACRGSKIFGL